MPREVNNLIHAQAVPVSYIAERFGVSAGREITETDFRRTTNRQRKKSALPTGGSREAIKDSEILIERYSLPTAEEPDGRLEIVAAGKLLYLGPCLSQRRTRRKKGSLSSNRIV
ncbi:MAG: hypothetical protein ACLRSW_12870 [Christensenellaceae bacterium]